MPQILDKTPFCALFGAKVPDHHHFNNKNGSLTYNTARL